MRIVVADTDGEFALGELCGAYVFTLAFGDERTGADVIYLFDGADSAYYRGFFADDVFYVEEYISFPWFDVDPGESLRCLVSTERRGQWTICVQDGKAIGLFLNGDEILRGDLVGMSEATQEIVLTTVKELE